MDPVVWLAEKYDLDVTTRSPIEIPNVTRETFARWLYLWGATRGVEVGVERAEYSVVLCQQNPALTLWAVDAWQGYNGYRDHVDQQKLDRFCEEASEALSPYRAIVVRKFSVDAAADFADGSLDFVYLDANHSFPYLTADLAAWSPKVRVGGVIAGHDFRRHRWPNQMHVEQVIHGWTDAYAIHPWFVLGRKEKREGELRDDGRTWMWVHEPRPTWRKGQRVIKQ